MKILFYFLSILSLSRAFSLEVNMPPSVSEQNGLAILTNEDLQVYSIGISTGGVAEMRMVELNPNCQIIATTIDLEGAKIAEKRIDEHGLSRQITVKIEDVSQPLPYKNDTFDFIYARLVLHYLTKAQLTQALDELYRTLKNGGKLFVVVRSIQCHEANAEGITYDSSSGLTTYTTSEGLSYSRYYHTEKSIGEYLMASGFSINNIKSYEEQLYIDFQRTKIASHVDSLIEIFASK